MMSREAQRMIPEKWVPVFGQDRAENKNGRASPAIRVQSSSFFLECLFQARCQIRFFP
jgi:hypothetical protein